MEGKVKVYDISSEFVAEFSGRGLLISFSSAVCSGLSISEGVRCWVLWVAVGLVPGI